MSQPQATGPILAIENLHVTMGPQEILHGIDLTVAQGAIVAVLGSNGVGKTTLMRAISGVYRASRGGIAFRGEAIANLPAHRIVKLGLSQAPEGRQIFSNMSVRENLVLGGGDVGLGELDRMLDMFPVLRERLRQNAGSLSGGEQQMLCIARALMRRPALLLLDEPSLGLAPMVVAQIFDLVQRIRAEGVSILLVEQNARAALRVADHAAVMEDGRIVLAGPAAQLRDDPRIAEAYLGGHAH
ncbi:MULTISPECIES: ABC transporter ATP-binding protein [Azospirillum]|uniref:ABC transporter ATP-binding protein n=2 Tax=Azospirillum brasilense TaxID=192 RepID=A0ABU4PJ66_AZOBR|nr:MULTISPECIES: ABC transporter ATP-binding protein [Azospirillum]MDW7553189.1 ABC transporter ATP-binding protein [Azospirillum brasilense]MDW7593433.1 ABC transporter ATP-binding protein [Azospirillum brasilense]MDW7628508.1 ABC transporter ATP-binding protein [Azospirillum brasilense]MDX5955397.1 ABC transporter ATP-binding protein [Azospirillum brasilense]OPH14970.1 leucine/isoleucine/valine transporter ATP-binding subunit [Azospirillum brasilense]